MRASVARCRARPIPVDESFGLVDLRGVGDALRRLIAAAEACRLRFPRAPRAVRMQPSEASRSCSEAARVVGRDRQRSLQQHRSGIEPGIHLHDRNRRSLHRPPGSRAGSAPRPATAAAARRGCSRSRVAGVRALRAAGSARRPRPPARPAATRMSCARAASDLQRRGLRDGQPALERRILHRARGELSPAAPRADPAASARRRRV